MSSNCEEVTGVVDMLFCAKPGFSAGVMYSGGRKVSFSVRGLVTHGESVTLRGKWENHPKYGKQFKATNVVYTMPCTTEGLEAWLRTYGHGIGPVKAKQAIESYGLDLTRLLVEDPQQIAIELRLPYEEVEKLGQNWIKKQSEVNAMSALLTMDLTQAEAEALYERFSGSAVAVLKDDPYSVLGLVPNFGWSRVDALATKLGIHPLDDRRIDASIVEVLRTSFREGSTAVPFTDVYDKSCEFVGSEGAEKITEERFARLIDKKRIKKVGTDGLGLPKSVSTEEGLLARFQNFKELNVWFDPLSVDELLEQAKCFSYRGKPITLDESQLDAIELAITHRGVVITGGAGSGKTLIAKAIHRLYDLDDRTIALCAPTGKAARRLTEVIGREALTIHRLLGFDFATGGFVHNINNRLSHEVILVDEVSMCDSGLLWSLLQAVRDDAAVIMIGDPNQLPPVGAGYPLRDILQHELMPIVKLQKCHRQAGELASNSVAILDGVLEQSSLQEGVPPWLVNDRMMEAANVLASIEYLFSDYKGKTARLKDWGYGDLFSHQFMTAKHKGVLGTQAINELLQRLHQATLGNEMPIRNVELERLPLIEGDKVIHTENNYLLNVMNGTLGKVIHSDPLVIQYEDAASKDGWREVEIPKDCTGQVSLAYCLTPHKMQGSQVPCAIVICPRQHGFMQNRNWLYTAVTRAQQTAIVIGDMLGCRGAVTKMDLDRRTTVLQFLAKQEQA